MVVCQEAPPSLEEEIRLQTKTLAKARVLLKKWDRGDVKMPDLLDIFSSITSKVPVVVERLHDQLKGLRTENADLQGEKEALEKEAAELRDQNMMLRTRTQKMRAQVGRLVQAANLRIGGQAAPGDAARPAEVRDAGAQQERRPRQQRPGGMGEGEAAALEAAGPAAVERAMHPLAAAASELKAASVKARPPDSVHEQSEELKPERISQPADITLSAHGGATKAAETKRPPCEPLGLDFDGVTYFDLSASDIDIEEEEDTSYVAQIGLMADEVAKAQGKDLSEIEDEELEQAIQFLTMRSTLWSCSG